MATPDAQPVPTRVGVGTIIGFGYGILALLAAFGGVLNGEFLAALCLLLSGIAAFPMATTLVQKRFNVAVSGGLRLALVLGFLIAAGLTMKHAPANSGSPEATSSDAAGAPQVATLPETQQAFNAANATAQAGYDTASNELKKSGVRKQRDASVMQATGGGVIENWTGTLKKLGTNGDGNALIEITPDGCACTVKTWNNDFSDIQDQTLIPFGSALFKQLEAMQEGQRVRFSGRILRESSMTESGSVQDPEWIVRFSNVVASP